MQKQRKTNSRFESLLKVNCFSVRIRARKRTTKARQESMQFTYITVVGVKQATSTNLRSSTNKNHLCPFFTAICFVQPSAIIVIVLVSSNEYSIYSINRQHKQQHKQHSMSQCTV